MLNKTRVSAIFFEGVMFHVHLKDLGTPVKSLAVKIGDWSSGCAWSWLLSHLCQGKEFPCFLLGIIIPWPNTGRGWNVSQGCFTDLCIGVMNCRQENHANAEQNIFCFQEKSRVLVSYLWLLLLWLRYIEN